MHQQERRKAIRRQIEAAFQGAPDERRRFNYERRGRTTVLPVPTAMLFRGDTRRFRESGTE
jgi:hypothetical protein